MDLSIHVDTEDKEEKTTETASKRRGIMPKEEQEVKKILKYLIKLSLNSAQQLRMLKGVMIWTCSMLADNRYIEAIKKSTKEYDNVVTNLKDKKESADDIRENVGIPCVWAFNGAMKELVKEKKESPQNKILDNIKEAAKGWTWKTLHSEVPHFRISKMRDQDRKRIELACPKMFLLLDQQISEATKITPAVVCMLLVQSFEQERRYREMRGQAPAGDLERRLQAALESGTLPVHEQTYWICISGRRCTMLKMCELYEERMPVVTLAMVPIGTRNSGAVRTSGGMLHRKSI